METLWKMILDRVVCEKSFVKCREHSKNVERDYD